MILDITFTDGSEPKQYQHVRRTAVYAQPSVISRPVLVIHFYDNLYPVMHIDLERVDCLTVTND